MEVSQQSPTYETVIRVVLDLLESDGCEGVQVRTVAKRARVSLTTLYKLFPTRDDLIVDALTHWMDENGYAQLDAPPPDATLYDALTWLHRQIFEPWERNPRMLEAYQRARIGPGGERLDMQGMAAVGAVVGPFFERLDPGYAEDLQLVLTNMVCGAIDRFALVTSPSRTSCPSSIAPCICSRPTTQPSLQADQLSRVEPIPGQPRSVRSETSRGRELSTPHLLLIPC